MTDIRRMTSAPAGFFCKAAACTASLWVFIFCFFSLSVARLLEDLALKFRPGGGEGARRKPAGIAELLVPQDLRVDPVRAIVDELTSPPGVIAFADELKDAFPRLRLVP